MVADISTVNKIPAQATIRTTSKIREKIEINNNKARYLPVSLASLIKRARRDFFTPLSLAGQAIGPREDFEQKLSHVFTFPQSVAVKDRCLGQGAIEVELVVEVHAFNECCFEFVEEPTQLIREVRAHEKGVRVEAGLGLSGKFSKDDDIGSLPVRGGTDLATKNTRAEDG